MSAGWFDDPSGRCGRRWFDGARWSEHVVGANGTPTTDALPDSGTPLPPPVAQPPVPPSTPPGPPPGGARPFGAAAPYGAPLPWAPRVAERRRPGIGLAVGLVGVAAIALGLFVLNWIDGDRSTFLDFAESARDANTDGADLAPTLAITYGAWAGFALLALTVAAVLAAGLPIPATSDRVQRIGGTIVAGAGAVLNTVTVSQLDRGLDLEAGGYVATAGYFVVILGFVLGTRPGAAAPGTGAPHPGVPYAGVPR